MTDRWDVEGAAWLVLAAAGLDPEGLHGVAAIANCLFGPGGVVDRPARLVPGDALLAPRHGMHLDRPDPRDAKAFQIWVRSRISAVRKRWAIGHELGEWALGIEDYRGPDRELYCEAISAALNMPRGPFRTYCNLRGLRFAALAADFGTTEMAAALRYGEVTEAPIAVVCDGVVHLRGSEYAWGDDLLALPYRAASNGWAVIPLDGGTRVAIVAEP